MPGEALLGICETPTYSTSRCASPSHATITGSDIPCRLPKGSVGWMALPWICKSKSNCHPCGFESGMHRAWMVGSPVCSSTSWAFCTECGGCWRCTFGVMILRIRRSVWSIELVRRNEFVAIMAKDVMLDCLAVQARMDESSSVPDCNFRGTAAG